MNLASNSNVGPLSILHTESSTGWGGQEIRVLTEARGMLDRDHQVMLIAPPQAEIVPAARRIGIPVGAIADITTAKFLDEVRLDWRHAYSLRFSGLTPGQRMTLATIKSKTPCYLRGLEQNAVKQRTPLRELLEGSQNPKISSFPFSYVTARESNFLGISTFYTNLDSRQRGNDGVFRSQLDQLRRTLP